MSASHPKQTFRILFRELTLVKLGHGEIEKLFGRK